MKRILSLILVALLILSFGFCAFASEMRKIGNATFSDIEGFKIYQQTEKRIIYLNQKNSNEHITLSYLKGSVRNNTEDIRGAQQEGLNNLLNKSYGEKELEEKFTAQNGVKTTVKTKGIKADYYKTAKDIPFYYGEVSFTANASGYNEKSGYLSTAFFSKGNDLYIIDYTNDLDRTIDALSEFLDTIEFVEEEKINTDTIKIKIDGEYVFPDSEPQIVNDRTLCPIRVVAEKLGYKVDWDGETASAVITDGKTTLRIKIGTNVIEKTALTYDEELGMDVTKTEVITCDVASQIINDRTYLPLRAVGEALGCNVDWEGTTRTVVIVSK